MATERATADWKPDRRSNETSQRIRSHKRRARSRSRGLRKFEEKQQRHNRRIVHLAATRCLDPQHSRHDPRFVVHRPCQCDLRPTKGGHRRARQIPVSELRSSPPQPQAAANDRRLLRRQPADHRAHAGRTTGAWKPAQSTKPMDAAPRACQAGPRDRRPSDRRRQGGQRPRICGNRQRGSHERPTTREARTDDRLHRFLAVRRDPLNHPRRS